MNIFINGSYGDLEEPINNFKSFKLRSYLGDNVKYCYAAILVGDEILEMVGDFKSEHLG